MNNYTILIGEMKRKTVNFSRKVCKGISIPNFKFVSDMFYGMLEAQEVHLSKIARVLKENITLKKTIERLSRNLVNFSESEKIFNNYTNCIKEDMNERSIVIIDGSDLSKPNSLKLEKMCEIRDGSTGEITQGYHVLEMVGLTSKHKMPVPLYTKLYSSKEEEYISEDNEVIKGLKYVSTKVSKNSIRAFDRGFDNNQYYEYLLKNNEKFVIRAKKNRNVIHNGSTINIMKLAKEYKGKYKMNMKTKEGKNIELKISMVEISLCKYPNKKINMIIVIGFGKEPMILLSNLKSNDERLAEVITKVYLMRWKIEEYFKFKKQQFNLEDIRIRHLQAIKNLNVLLTILIGMIGLMSEKQNTNRLVMELINVSKRIYGKKKFVYYAIADGIHEILSKGLMGIKNLIKPDKPIVSGQLTFNLDNIS